MKFIFPIIALIFSAGFIYYLADRLVRYRNRYKWNMDLLCIAYENPSHLNTIRHTIEYCSSTEPPIDCSLTKSRRKTAIQKLLNGTVDLVLISEKDALELNERSPYLRISRLENANSDYIDFVILNNKENDEQLYLLWNHAYFSESRDRFLFFYKNDFRLLHCGYRDY